MARKSKSQTSQEVDFVPLMKELMGAYQAFEIYDAAYIRQHGLTVPQGNVVFCLGQSRGMTFKELGDQTLITKGTLTGVVDRLVDKKLVVRQPSVQDRRSIIVKLTSRGTKMFQDIYPKHMAHLQERFDQLSDRDKRQAMKALQQIKVVFS